jgi:uncharacterized membrane protein YozB (DUF420 family)
MTLDPKLVYWTGALANLLVIVTCAAFAVVRIRRGDIRGHKRLMLTASSLVVLFLVSFVLKGVVLGGEDVAAWSTFHRTVLRTHETFVLAMLLGGAYAGSRAWRFRRTLGPGPLQPPSDASRRDRARHRRGGWIAIVGSALGFATAALVLAGMFERAGG